MSKIIFIFLLSSLIIFADSTSTKNEALTGGRSKASIMRTVMQNLAALRYAYNRRLRVKPNIFGKITVKFAINEYGKVVSSKVVNNTINDQIFGDTVAYKVSRWTFDTIPKPGDITEVVYPFVFSTSDDDEQLLELRSTLKGSRNSDKLFKALKRKEIKLEQIHYSNFSEEPGKIKLKFKINNSGKIIYLESESSTISNDFASAIIDAINLWKFRKDRKSEIVTEFNFTFFFKKAKK